MANKKFTVGSLWQHGYATPEVKIIFVVVNDDGNYNIAVAICVDDSVNGSETLSYVPIDGGKLRPGSMFRFSSESFMAMDCEEIV